ncbi:4-hydroxy-tetrahydrodipicolinate reductase [Thermodesulfobacteriota bacterium]
MIKAVMTGASGRMGREIIREIFASEGITLAAAVEAGGHPCVGESAFRQAGIDAEGPPIGDNLDRVEGPFDVIIDFSLPSALEGILEAAEKNGSALIIGSTGHGKEQLERIHDVSARVSCVYAPNMSVGVNILFHLVREASRVMGEGFDVEVVETHHRLKKDAPSGTALKIAEIAASSRGLDPEAISRFGRRGQTGQRPAEEIGIHSIRGGDEVGEHIVMFDTVGERISISHRSRSRATFARGAVMAARWASGKPPGLYGMNDVLGLG